MIDWWINRLVTYRQSLATGLHNCKRINPSLVCMYNKEYTSKGVTGSDVTLFWRDIMFGSPSLSCPFKLNPVIMTQFRRGFLLRILETCVIYGSFVRITSMPIECFSYRRTSEPQIAAKSPNCHPMWIIKFDFLRHILYTFMMRGYFWHFDGIARRLALENLDFSRD